MKGTSGEKGRRKDYDEQDAYMDRIRARAEMEPDSDEYSGSDEEGAGEERSGGSSSEEEEQEQEQDGGAFEPGRGYDTEEEEESDESEEEEEDEAAQAKREAVAAVRSLPLAERLALMASGAMHDEGSSGITKRRRGRRTLADAAEDGAKKKPEGEAAAVDSWGVVAKPTNKHAPTEVSSKKPVPRLRAMTLPPTGGGRRRKARDPRFDPALGKVNYEQFRQAYGFLEGYQEKEMTALQAAMKKAKSQRKKGDLKAAMNAIRQEKSERQRSDRARAVARKSKREERAKVAAGKSPFFLKKREKRRLELEDRYEQLAREGKLERALAKKRRRNAAKDHRWLPHARRTGPAQGAATTEGGRGGLSSGGGVGGGL